MSARLRMRSRSPSGTEWRISDRARCSLCSVSSDSVTRRRYRDGAIGAMTGRELARRLGAATGAAFDGAIGLVGLIGSLLSESPRPLLEAGAGTVGGSARTDGAMSGWGNAVASMRWTSRVVLNRDASRSASAVSSLRHGPRSPTPDRVTEPSTSRSKSRGKRLAALAAVMRL